jgi:hypothetical protein
MDISDRSQFAATISAAAKKHKCSEESLVQSSKVIAIAVLETNRTFTSALPLWLRTWRRVLQIKKEMDGESRDA